MRSLPKEEHRAVLIRQAIEKTSAGAPTFGDQDSGRNNVGFHSEYREVRGI
jgi:hypothetical protein